MWPELSAGPPHAWAELEQGLHEGQSTTSPTSCPHPHSRLLVSWPCSLSLSEPWLLLCTGSSLIKDTFSGVGIGFVVGAAMWLGHMEGQLVSLPPVASCVHPPAYWSQSLPLPQLLAELGLLGGAAEAPGALPVLT